MIEQTQKKIDNLLEDPILPNQLWWCVSFVSPERIKNCSIRGLKCRGVFATREEANERAQFLQSIDPDFDTFVGEVGKWLPWSPNPESVNDQVYAEEKLQEMVTERKKNLKKAAIMEEERKREMIEDSVAREDDKLSKRQQRMRKKISEKNANAPLVPSRTSHVDKIPDGDSTDDKEKQELIKQERKRIEQNSEAIEKGKANNESIQQKINNLQSMYLNRSKTD
jgi:hypothetical protein